MSTDRPDFYTLYARQKMGAPEGWQWFRMEALGQHPTYLGGSLVTGAVAPLVTRGKNKGRLNWRRKDKATEFSFAVTRDALLAFEREWEMETGKCRDCGGSGQYSYGWDHKIGRLLQPCKRCDATGIAP